MLPPSSSSPLLIFTAASPPLPLPVLPGLQSSCLNNNGDSHKLDWFLHIQPHSLPVSTQHQQTEILHPSKVLLVLCPSRIVVPNSSKHISLLHTLYRHATSPDSNAGTNTHKQGTRQVRHAGYEPPNTYLTTHLLLPCPAISSTSSGPNALCAR